MLPAVHRLPDPPAERGLSVTQAMVLGELQPRRPEPPAQAVQVAGSDWWQVAQKALDRAINSGQASRQDVGAFLHSMSSQQRAGQPSPEWEQKAFVARMYKSEGPNFKSLPGFVMWLRNTKAAREIGLSGLSPSTGKRWIAEYEALTGEQVRPGRGSSRPKQL